MTDSHMTFEFLFFWDVFLAGFGNRLMLFRNSKNGHIGDAMLTRHAFI